MEATAQVKTSSRRVPGKLSEPLYCYVEKENAAFARVEGKAKYGSFSAFINALVSKARGAAPAITKLGTRKDRNHQRKKKARRKK